MLKKFKLKNKKILLLSWSDNYGGAAQSCYSIYRCLYNVNNKVKLFVQKKILKDSLIQTYPNITFNLFIRKVANFLMYNLRKTSTDHSYNLINSDILKVSAANSYDIVNIHWFGSETLSIHDLTKIKSKIILTLHDMWAFCGSEHYLQKLPSEYFFNGEKKLVKKIDLLIWKRKFSLWKKKIPIIVPSNWLHEKLKQSKLMYNWPSIVIPYPVDQKIFKKKIYIEKRIKKFSILFVNAGKLLDERKGFDLLMRSLEKLSIPFVLHVVGRIKKSDIAKTKIEIKYHGYIKNKIMLAKIYNKMNALALPSRIDNLPNVGLEAHSCGLPIVSFNVGGMPDIITHKKTGYLAKPYDVNDFARGLEFVSENGKILGGNALKKSKKWSYKLISEKYLKFINSTLKF